MGRLQFLLADIVGGFVQDEAGQQFLDMLFTAEDTLVAVVGRTIGPSAEAA